MTIRIDRNKEFAGKVVLVTGAGSGIGEGCARLLGQLGARVVVTDIDLANAEKVANAIAAHGHASAFQLDVADPVAIEKLIATCERDFGGLDGAVNNAGIAGPRVPLDEYGIDDWRRVIEVDLNAVFYALRHEIPAMRRRGGGAIVNIGSIASSIGIPLTGPYDAAKHAVLGLTRTAALENATHNVRINCVGPGYIETPFIMSRGPEVLAGYRAKHPMNKLGSPENIAEVVAFLLSDRAAFTTGSYYVADGGYTAQ